MGESRATPATEFTFTCPLAAGLHARPASSLAEVANRYACDGTLTNLRSGTSANLRSPLSIIAADIRQGDSCRVDFTGVDSAAAAMELRRFVEQTLPTVDDATAIASTQPAHAELPRALRDVAVHYLSGTPVSEGIAVGLVLRLGQPATPRSAQASLGVVVERGRFRDAIAGVKTNISSLRTRATSKEASSILSAHLAILDDVAFTSRVNEQIDGGESAENAIQKTADEFRALLGQSTSVYIRERALDVQDVAARLMEQLGGAAPAQVELSAPSVIVAESLTPQELLRLKRQFVSALVVEYAGATSHTMILARSLGIPALAGVRGASVQLRPNTRVIVDAIRGLVLAADDAAVAAFYAGETETLQRRDAALRAIAKAPARTADGRTLEVAANVSSALEIEAAFRSGADGIGVFRTEMLFVDRDAAPTEQEQFEIYAEAARAAGVRPVIIRTADIGGDKRVPHLDLPDEENPFLGYRGARIYGEHQALFRTQLRAILRASAMGNVWIMLPMITSADEVRRARQTFDDVRRELSAEGIAIAERVPLGIMIEVPAAAFAIAELAEVSDFFSLGTNDLAQYFFAADRGNARVTSLADPLQPAFLRFLKQTVEAARAQKKWIGICGEIGGDAGLLPLWLALGLDEISASVPNVAGLKQRVTRLRQDTSEALLDSALACRSAAEVRALLETAESAPLPLLDPALVIVGSTAADREQAIRAMVDALYVAGRTNARDQVEDAIVAREATYSTALGFGFAVPHCKNDAVLADSVVVLKLAREIPWSEESVRFAVLLAMRASAKDNTHMQVFSRLSRKLMDPDFRTRLERAAGVDSVVSLLKDALG